MFVMLIIPSIASASWWNPFSWKLWNVFNEKSSEIQDVKNITKEPEKKPENIIITNKSVDSKEDRKEQAKIEKERKALDAQKDALRIAEEKFKQQQLDIAKQAEQLRQEELKRQAKEQEVILDEEESDKTSISVREITCTERPAGTYYLLPFNIKGEWISGWIQVKIADGNGGTVVKGFDLDKSNIGDGFIFSQSGRVLGGSRNIELNAGLIATYQINIHSVVPSYNRVGIRSYSTSSLIAEESGRFTLPSCE